MSDEIKGPYLLDPEAYPFTIQAVGHDDALLWSQTVERPEGLGMLRIPGFHGAVKYVRCSFANGEVEVSYATSEAQEPGEQPQP